MAESKTLLGTAQQVRLASLWFAMFAQWLAIMPISASVDEPPPNTSM